MNKNNRQQRKHRRAIGKIYIDTKGNEQIRAGDTDFQTLTTRHIEVITNLPGFEQDKELDEWMGGAIASYDEGEYGTALQYLTWALTRMPALEPYVFYYIRVCRRVLSIPLTKEEVKYKAKHDRYRALPKWLRWTMPGLELRVRCKWCGRYTSYIHPNVPTHGWNTYANSCISCGRMYPMPSWLWDSPDGRAYSYYRMSGADGLNEFEQDYDPKLPLLDAEEYRGDDDEEEDEEEDEDARA